MDLMKVTVDLDDEIKKATRRKWVDLRISPHWETK
jgi:hypothetical protein